MNWRQIFATSTLEEHEEITTELLAHIEKYGHHVAFARAFAVWKKRRQRFNKFFYLVPSVRFGLRAAVLILVLLTIMPFHPLAIPTAIGGGISFALLLQGGNKKCPTS